MVIETPTNPVLRVHDIARWAAAAHGVGARLLVDGTFATPINQRPLALGADLVVHSGTKYLGGHADVTAGAVVGPRALLDGIDPHQELGSTLDPFSAFLDVVSQDPVISQVKLIAEPWDVGRMDSYDIGRFPPL